MNNDSNINNNDSNNYLNKFISTLSFTLLTIIIINLTAFFLQIFLLDTLDFAICQWPIFYKHQYYRIITHNFIHKNFIHFILNMIFFYFIGKNVEKYIGSLYTLMIIFYSSIILSIIYIIIICILKYILISLMHMKEYNYDFYCSFGFSGVLFSLHFIQCNFKSTSNNVTYFLGLIPIKYKTMPLFNLLFIQVLNPNCSFLAHLSGLFTGYLIKNVFSYFLFPKKEDVIGFETFLKKFACLCAYVYIDDIKNNEELNEIDTKIKDICCIKKILSYCVKNTNIKEMEKINEINSSSNMI